MPIKIKVDVTKLRKELFFKGAKGTYADLVLIETPDSQYGDDYRVVQDVSKEARERGEKGPIVGNGRNFGKTASKPPQKTPPPQRKPPVDPDLDAAEDDVPF
jgi:hypothetical protein